MTGSEQTLFYAPVTDDMKTGHGGGLSEEGELIETVELPTATSLNFMMSTDIETTTGLLFALTWFQLYKQSMPKA